MNAAEPLKLFALIVVGALALFFFFQLGNAFGRSTRYGQNGSTFP